MSPSRTQSRAIAVFVPASRCLMATSCVACRPFLRNRRVAVAFVAPLENKNSSNSFSLNFGCQSSYRTLSTLNATPIVLSNSNRKPANGQIPVETSGNANTNNSSSSHGSYESYGKTIGGTGTGRDSNHSKYGRNGALVAGLAGTLLLVAGGASIAAADGGNNTQAHQKGSLQRILSVIPQSLSSLSLSVSSFTGHHISSYDHSMDKARAVNVKAAEVLVPANDSAVGLDKSSQEGLRSSGSAVDLKKRYKLGKVIGEGTFATVRVATDKRTGELVAVKEIKKDLSDSFALENEVRIMRTTGVHSNIVSLLDVFDSNNILYIVMDYAGGGELFDRIIDKGELSEKNASKIMKEAVLGAKHLHDKNIIHLDIKPENLLLAKGKHKTNGDSSTEAEEQIKLADFGLAIHLPTNEHKFVRTECVGTPAYWAPELVKNEPFGTAVDIWALGCVMYILLCGSHPFDPYGDAPESRILARVVEGDYDRDNAQYQSISPQGKELLARMLEPNPNKRITASEILKHPWLTRSEEILSEQPIGDQREYIKKLKAFKAIRILRLLPLMLNVSHPECVGTMFDESDQDKDGFLSRQEMSALWSKLGVVMDDIELDELFTLFGSKGKISKTQFEYVVNKYNQSGTDESSANNEELKMLFDVFDRNKDGLIEKSDCVHVLGVIGVANNDRSMLYNEMFDKLAFQVNGGKQSGSNTELRKDISVVSKASELASPALLQGKVNFEDFVKYYREIEHEKRAQGIARGATMHMKHRPTMLSGHSSLTGHATPEVGLMAAKA